MIQTGSGLHVPQHARLMVAAQPSDTSACGFYRVLQPLAWLHHRRRIDLRVWQMPDRRFTVAASGTPPPGATPIFSSELGPVHAIVLQKPGGALYPGDPAEEAIAADLKRIGRQVVYELDDDLENVTKDNPVKHPSSFPGYLDRSRALIRSCGQMTTTTRYAAELYERRYGVKCHVVPNAIDLTLWRPDGWTPPEPRETVTIAWCASPNHVEDARLLIAPLREITRRHPHVRIVLAGYYYPLASTPGCGAGVAWHDLAKAIGPACEFVGGVERMEDWPAFARNLRADIWLAPLVNSVFARSKSNLKWLEATAAGAAMVASDVQPYRVGPDGEEWFDPPLGLVRDTREFVTALDTLIQHPEHRRLLWEKSDKVLREHFLVEHQAEAWMRVLESVKARGLLGS